MDGVVFAAEHGPYRTTRERPTHRHFLLGEPARFAEPDRERHGDRSTPESTLLTATRDDRLEPDTWFATDVEASDALGAVDLVTRDREDVDLEVVDVDGDWGRTEMSARVRV